jgi:hypothetical protein
VDIARLEITLSRQGSAMTKEGWFIHLPGNAPKGPFDTSTMEDYAHNGMINGETRISNDNYTKGRVVEAKRIARFFNIFSNVTEKNALTVYESAMNPPPVVSALTRREEDVAGIGRFMADGQDPTMICKLAERVDGICTPGENALYMAVQQRPIANFSPDAVVLTNRRVIIFRQKILGRLNFIDVPWLNVADVHLAEDIIGSTISVKGMNGHVEQISFLPKSQARKIYRIAQDMEEKMVELRRERSMEERRAGAANVIVNNDLGQLVNHSLGNHSNSDPVAALQTLKSMLESGLISQEEFDRKKSQILERM